MSSAFLSSNSYFSEMVEEWDELAYKGRVDFFVTLNAGATYACSSWSRRIWLLEFFIHKISSEKNGDRQPPHRPPPPLPPTTKKKKTNTHLQKNKTGKGGGRACMTRPDWPRSKNEKSTVFAVNLTQISLCLEIWVRDYPRPYPGWMTSSSSEELGMSLFCI